MSEKLKAFHQTYQEVDGLYHHYAKAFGLSDTAFWMLYFIHQSERACTQRELCDEWYFPPQTIHSALKTLQAQGHIYLESAPGNRKNKQIYLTAEGHAFASRVIAPLVHAERNSFERLKERERDLLVSVTQKHVGLLREEMNQILERSSED